MVLGNLGLGKEYNECRGSWMNKPHWSSRGQTSSGCRKEGIRRATAPGVPPPTRRPACGGWETGCWATRLRRTASSLSEPSELVQRSREKMKSRWGTGRTHLGVDVEAGDAPAAHGGVAVGHLEQRAELHRSRGGERESRATDGVLETFLDFSYGLWGRHVLETGHDSLLSQLSAGRAMAGRWPCSRRGGIDYTWNWRARCVTAEYLKRLPFLFSQDFQRVFAEVRSTSYKFQHRQVFKVNCKWVDSVCDTFHLPDFDLIWVEPMKSDNSVTWICQVNFFFKIKNKNKTILCPWNQWVYGNFFYDAFLVFEMNAWIANFMLSSALQIQNDSTWASSVDTLV